MARGNGFGGIWARRITVEGLWAKDLGRRIRLQRRLLMILSAIFGTYKYGPVGGLDTNVEVYVKGALYAAEEGYDFGKHKLV